MYLKKEQIEEAVNLYNSGLDCEQIGKMFDRTGRTIIYHLAKRGIDVIHRCSIKTATIRSEHLDEIKSAYKKGESGGKIGSRYGYSPQNIYRILKSVGIPIRKGKDTYKHGKEHHNWRGGRRQNSSGYIIIYNPNHPKVDKQGYVTEHLLVWMDIHKKSLPKNMVIHHLNGRRDDNRPENLVAILKGAHHQLAEPYKERIRELETEISKLKRVHLMKGVV